MKNTLPLIAVLFIGACITPLTPEQKALRHSVVGAYEKSPAKLYFWGDGKAEAFVNGVKAWIRRWSINFAKGEILIYESKPLWNDHYEAEVHRINNDDSNTWIGSIKRGKRIERSKENQTTYKKINIPHIP